MADTWRAVAEALAARMEYQAYNCPVGTGIRLDNGPSMGGVDTGDTPHVPEEHPECPFCLDTVAYERFLRKHREGNVGRVSRK